MTDTKLIILRGPSGSGKSTTAKQLFKKAKRRVALIEQDHYRFIFNQAGGGSKSNSTAIHRMIQSDVLIALDEGYDVILEGILGVKSYDKILNEIFEKHPQHNYMYYFDISFEETARRHEIRKRENGSEFSAEDMREWYAAAHRSNHELERIIPEDSSLEDTLERILFETEL